MKAVLIKTNKRCSCGKKMERLVVIGNISLDFQDDKMSVMSHIGTRNYHTKPILNKFTTTKTEDMFPDYIKLVPKEMDVGVAASRAYEIMSKEHTDRKKSASEMIKEAYGEDAVEIEFNEAPFVCRHCGTFTWKE